MKDLVKDVLEKILGKTVNNEVHAVTMLKNKLSELGGEDFAKIVDDIPSLLEFLEVYLPEISEFLTKEFWNTFSLGGIPSRKGKLLNPKKYITERKIIESVGKSIVGMHNDLKYVITSRGISILKNNRVVCSAKDWREIEGPLKEYSAKVVFNHIEGVELLKVLVPKKYWEGRDICLSKTEFNKPRIKYITTVELIDIFTNNKIVEQSCLKDG